MARAVLCEKRAPAVRACRRRSSDASSTSAARRCPGLPRSRSWTCCRGDDLDETRAQIAPVLEAQGYDYFWRPSDGDDVPPFYAWFIKRDAERACARTTSTWSRRDYAALGSAAVSRLPDRARGCRGRVRRAQGRPRGRASERSRRLHEREVRVHPSCDRRGQGRSSSEPAGLAQSALRSRRGSAETIS